MIDFHSHILPNIDDGSKSAEESLKLLRREKKQGIDLVAATPHFNVHHNNTVERFLRRRDEAWKKLQQEDLSDMPKILLGAEVEYYYNISNLENLSSLCLENTNLLLLEMPFQKWSSLEINEVEKLSKHSDVIPVLAHVDRYLRFQDNDTLEKLLFNGVIFQVNAEAFLSIFQRRKVMKMLDRGQIGFLGSDCHDIEHRPPCMKEAMDVISKKHGSLRMLFDIEEFYKS
ncbi:MAG: capsular polysaccharide biosynthesis protein [Oscillospiraceae bacterium]|nr:capsular polysaccharide biosynthesis protein [Candidatus Equicaccousia limihippi]